MISKFRKLQDTWFAKIILILTGLSFVSLFGVAGYMGSVGKNRPVIKVDSFELLQGDAIAQLDNEVQMAKKLFGDTFEVSDTIRLNMLQNLVEKNLNDMIIRNISKKNGISISDDLVRQVIYSQSEFRGADGKFDINRMRQILALSGTNEAKYINSVKLDVARQNVIQTPVENMNVPDVMLKYLAKIYNQKRIFKYITLDIKNLPIDRQVSEDEIQQYYQDFNVNFMAPETRDISFFYLSNNDISKQTQISDEDAEIYYQENASQFETPETRQLAQMVFDDEAKAQEALKDVKSGQDFYSVAQTKANQDKATTDLGFVAQDMMLELLAKPVFSASAGSVVGPIKTDMGWHIVKVITVKAGAKTDKAKALAQIKENLKKEKMYDEAYELASQIEDKIGAGTDFSDIAQSLKTKIHTVKNLDENGQATLSDAQLRAIATAPDFIDMAFSYNEGEISQVIELDDGIALLKVDHIYDTHPKDIAEVRPEIVKMWEDNERTAIAQEITNDVLHDLENGDGIDEIAARFKLQVKTTSPLSRKQSFAGLTDLEMNDLFLEKAGSAKIFNNKGIELIAVTDKIINPTTPVQSDDELVRQAKLEISQEYANRLLSDFSSDYDVRVKYRLLGLAD
ncbi:MAG: peptidyl-prolyl cis-trans isomerase [Alphaproteobacteria bacterium]|nr:peptidyl-prolyl cis-trans isomerase [Alphaproteobacteria bacterium]